jgi:hypothetical protein
MTNRKCSSNHTLTCASAHNLGAIGERRGGTQQESGDGLANDVSREIAELKPHHHLSRRPRPGFHPRLHGMGVEHDDAHQGGG